MLDANPDLTTQVAPAWTREAVYARWLQDCESELKRCWQRSSHTLQRLESTLATAALPTSIETVLVTGSLARMEQQQGSDCDVIVVVASDCDAPDALEAWQAVWKPIERAGLKRPQGSGIYSVAGRWDRFGCCDSRGQVDESQVDFGHRMQLLLESQPIYQLDRFRELGRKTAERFLLPDLHEDRRSAVQSSQYLAREACRYYQSLWIRSHWIRSPRRHQLINYKLRFTRLLAYAGLLALLGVAETSDRPTIDVLCAGLSLTPLERVGYALAQSNTNRRPAEEASDTETTMSSWSDLLECVEVLLSGLQQLRNSPYGEDSAMLVELSPTTGVALDRLSEILRESFTAAGQNWAQTALRALLF